MVPTAAVMITSGFKEDRLHVGRDTISKALNTFQLYQMWW